MTGEDVVVIRPFRATWVSTVLAVFLLVAFVIVAVLLRQSKTGAIFEVSDQIAMVGIGVLLACGSLLFATARVRADAEGIEVRNVIFLNRRYTWLEVVSVSFPDGASFARLELPEDEYCGMLAIQAVDRDRAVEAVRALRRLHKQAWAEQP
ncbi:PH domain-containing protein [Amycolatopsis alkalitolerans]|uniref:PH domain-containing protein n=1 Tax=Amycolatopsis alkalitolerans TaxID=2547244 RepID=A0A5C4LVW8_9PSEU|nr:PH domain-containing protein [Amycolatopsis alkalitolerans]TNC23056.1 PH domain-containing protein [Amycolatopsis alkalitolerans]